MSVLPVTEAAARDMARRNNISVAAIKDVQVIRVLRILAKLPLNTAQVSVMRVSDAAQLWKHYNVAGELVNQLEERRRDRSGTGGPSAAIGHNQANITSSGMESPHSQSLGSGLGTPVPVFGNYGGSGLRAGLGTPASVLGNYGGSGLGSGIGTQATQRRLPARQLFPQSIRTPRRYVFPTQPPELHLTEVQQRENYGLTKLQISPRLMTELHNFKAWCAAPINTARTSDYATPNSTATIEKIGKSARAFLGYCAKYFGTPVGLLTLREYADPAQIMQFVAYLKARHSKVGNILNHLSLAKKINVFLGSEAQAGGPEKEHAAKIDSWLATLINQVHLTEPAPIKKAVPEATVLWQWVDDLTSTALFGIENDMQHKGNLTLATASLIQDAAVASLVTGRDIPPCRLDLIKHVVHPRHNEHARCWDPDCRDPDNCAGNFVELQPRPEAVSVSAIARHHLT
jgi:hypothetical protein